jgi:glutamate--cysteine ligase
MDVALGGQRYRDAWAAAAGVLSRPEQLPSARLLTTMAHDFDRSYVRLLRHRSTHTRDLLLGLPWSESQQQRFEALARESVIQQRCIEASDTVPFEAFRQDYLAPQRLGSDPQATLTPGVPLASST